MSKPQPVFLSIGAVARRTGISTPNIRMWEARHAAIQPQRSDTDRRLYTEADAERLSLLKQLVDVGHPIRTIASLEDGQLRKLLTEHSRSRAGIRNHRSRKRSTILLIGAGLGTKLRDHRLLEADIVAEHESIESALNQKQLPEADLLVIEIDTLFPEVIASIRELVRQTGAKRSLLIYFFINSTTANALVRTVAGLNTLRAPVDPAQLLRECVVQLNQIDENSDNHIASDHTPVPDKSFTQEQLAKLSTISSTVECECPQHLAGLLQALSAFENYSRQCEDRNPDDALLHAFLHRTTAQARRSMEDALREVLHAEGISVD